MTDAELATIMEALRESKRQLEEGADRRHYPTGAEEVKAIESLGLAIELLADIVYRMGKRK